MCVSDTYRSLNQKNTEPISDNCLRIVAPRAKEIHQIKSGVKPVVLVQRIRTASQSI